MTPSQRKLFGAAVITWFLSFVVIGFFGLYPDEDVRRASTFVQQLTIAASLGAIALFTFAAFFSATGIDGMRTAIAATLVVFFVVLTTHLIASPNLRNALDTPPVAVAANPAPAQSGTPGGSAAPTVAAAPAPFGRDIYSGLADFVKIVLLFYFGAVTVERVLAPGSKTEGSAAATAGASDTAGAEPPATPSSAPTESNPS
jgi:hypothetical protein